MSYLAHRSRLVEIMDDNSLVICYAGKSSHSNGDHYYHFDVNSNFFYLTGLEREGMILLIAKVNGETEQILFIEEADPLVERWTGKMPTSEEAGAIAEMEDVRYVTAFDGVMNRYLSRCRIETVYFDTFKNDSGDLPDFNLVQAQIFRNNYPCIAMQNLRDVLVPLREVKDEDEIADIRQAIDVTRQGLEFVMQNLKPGMIEDEVAADFAYATRKLGTRKYAFETISGAGINGCMMHYVQNDHEIEDGELILLDLGVKYRNYCSDITRTYPANGKFTERQKEIYNLVLAANYAVRDTAKPGMTLVDLNDVAKKVLGEGLVELGLIEDVEDVGTYYMHSVSHCMGIDCHDVDFKGDVLQPGFVISNEPGLYIDEEKIGIRIEDDLLITEDGCEVLSESVIRTVEEIESFMQGR